MGTDSIKRVFGPLGNRELEQNRREVTAKKIRSHRDERFVFEEFQPIISDMVECLVAFSSRE